MTDTTWTSTDRGVPIYWLNGARVADDYADFYDGVWADEAKPRNGSGTLYSLADPAPWTGTDHDGTELFDGAASRAIGQATVGVGAPGSTAVGAGPLNGAAAFASTEERPLYGLWHGHGRRREPPPGRPTTMYRSPQATATTPARP